jgi:hypothetical protein
LDSYQYHRRPRRARLSHRSLDRQPNDHLGRSCFRPHLFEHRRQILRGCTESDTDAYFDSNSNRNGDSHCNTDSNSNGDSDSYGNCDGDADRHTQGHTDAEAYTDAAAAPDSGTTTLALK